MLRFIALLMTQFPHANWMKPFAFRTTNTTNAFDVPMLESDAEKTAAEDIAAETLRLEAATGMRQNQQQKGWVSETQLG